jgi:hypothetical protein
MKGPIPITGKMILESEESQWRLLVRKLINEFPTSALIELEDKKVRIKIILERAIAPEQKEEKTSTRLQTNLEERVTNGLARSDEFFSNLMHKDSWIFIGYILSGNNERDPIVITHFTSINITIYSRKLKSETIDNFMPFNSNTKASLN